jgi:hypothetical protein
VLPEEKNVFYKRDIPDSSDRMTSNIPLKKYLHYESFKNKGDSDGKGKEALSAL